MLFIHPVFAFPQRDGATRQQTQTGHRTRFLAAHSPSLRIRPFLTPLPTVSRPAAAKQHQPDAKRQRLSGGDGESGSTPANTEEAADGQPRLSQVGRDPCMTRDSLHVAIMDYHQC